MDRRSQKKQARLMRTVLAKEFTDEWEKNYGKEPRAAPLEEQKTPPNTDENTGKEAAGSQVSQELTSTSAPNIPAEKYASDLPAEENPPHTGKETKSGSQCSQKLTTSSVPKAPAIIADTDSSETVENSESASEPAILHPILEPANLPHVQIPANLPQIQIHANVPHIAGEDWLPQHDGLQLSDKERARGLSFELMYDRIRDPE